MTGRTLGDATSSFTSYYSKDDFFMRYNAEAERLERALAAPTIKGSVKVIDKQLKLFGYSFVILYGPECDISEWRAYIKSQFPLAGVQPIEYKDRQDEVNLYYHGPQLRGMARIKEIACGPAVYVIKLLILLALLGAIIYSLQVNKPERYEGWTE